MSTQLAGTSFNAAQPFPQPIGLAQTLFPSTSRYHGLQALTVQQGGRDVAYLERRFLPDPAEFDDLYEHTVVQGDRLDNLAYKYLGDAEAFWRIADSNVGGMHPAELTAEVGRRLRITLPAGIPGALRA